MRVDTLDSQKGGKPVCRLGALKRIDAEKIKVIIATAAAAF